MSDIEEALAESSNQLVTLNVRVPRYCEQKIEVVRAMLQSKYRLQKISKQTTIEYIFQEAFARIEEQMKEESSKSVHSLKMVHMNSESIKSYPQNR
jgi:beta-galactosidase GanA